MKRMQTLFLYIKVQNGIATLVYSRAVSIRNELQVKGEKEGLKTLKTSDTRYDKLINYSTYLLKKTKILKTSMKDHLFSAGNLVQVFKFLAELK